MGSINRTELIKPVSNIPFMKVLLNDLLTTNNNDYGDGVSDLILDLRLFKLNKNLKQTQDQRNQIAKQIQNND